MSPVATSFVTDRPSQTTSPFLSFLREGFPFFNWSGKERSMRASLSYGKYSIGIIPAVLCKTWHLYGADYDQFVISPPANNKKKSGIVKKRIKFLNCYLILFDRQNNMSSIIDHWTIGNRNSWNTQSITYSNYYRVKSSQPSPKINGYFCI